MFLLLGLGTKWSHALVMRNDYLVQSPDCQICQGMYLKHYSELKNGTMTLASAMGFLTGECCTDKHWEVSFSKARRPWPSPKNMGIAQFHPSSAPRLMVMCCQWLTEVSTKPNQNVGWKQPLKHVACLFTGGKNGAQISEKLHICISVTASAFYTLQHKRRQCEGLCFSSPTFLSLSFSALAAFK